MHKLQSTYSQHDLALLRMIASAAGLVLHASNKRNAAIELASAMKEPDNLTLNCAGLGEEAQDVLLKLLASGGQMTVSSISRKYGTIRPLGPAAQQRERPQLEPDNPVETLWYHGLIGRAFDNKSDAQEYYYIPSDLLPLLPFPKPKTLSISALQNQSPTDKNILVAKQTLVDDACTTLAFLRTYKEDAHDYPESDSNVCLDKLHAHLHQPENLNMLLSLLQDMGCISKLGLTPISKNTRGFLSNNRSEQLRSLANAWHKSTRWVDLFSVSTIEFNHSDSIRIRPEKVRNSILDQLNMIGSDIWVDLNTFVKIIKTNCPDFQRVSGDYNSWYIINKATGKLLKGFKHWNLVEGALVKQIVTGPLHSLGMIDLSRNHESFRLNQMFNALMQNIPWKIAEEQKPLAINDKGLITAFRSSNRADRFLAARLGEWEMTRNPDLYRYRICASSLERAKEQGFTANHAISFLQRATEHNLPKSILKALQNWTNEGISAELTKMTVITFTSKSTLQMLLTDPQTKQYLEEQIGPLTVRVKYNNRKKLRDHMIKSGLILEIND